ncbi:hypothetical protein OQA88_3708 [Cercophora sp. LCS_1]
MGSSVVDFGIGIITLFSLVSPIRLIFGTCWYKKSARLQGKNGKNAQDARDRAPTTGNLEKKKRFEEAVLALPHSKPAKAKAHEWTSLEVVSVRSDKDTNGDAESSKRQKKGKCKGKDISIKETDADVEATAASEVTTASNVYMDDERAEYGLSTSKTEAREPVRSDKDMGESPRKRHGKEKSKSKKGKGGATVMNREAGPKANEANASASVDADSTEKNPTWPLSGRCGDCARHKPEASGEGEVTRKAETEDNLAVTSGGLREAERSCWCQR